MEYREKAWEEDEKAGKKRKPICSMPRSHTWKSWRRYKNGLGHVCVLEKEQYRIDSLYL
jgi:hypothetical protein